MSLRKTNPVLLSYPLSPSAPLPTTIPPMRIEPLFNIPEDDAEGYIVTFANHSGTHVDAPRHVIDGALKITDFDPDEFIFSHPVVVDIRVPDNTTVSVSDLSPHEDLIANADLLLLRFGYGEVRLREPTRYSANCPGFSVASARYLCDSFPRLRAIGLDVPSFSCIANLTETMAAHNVVFEGQRRFMIIEDMRLNIDLNHLKTVLLAPWLVETVDSAPCTVFGFLDDNSLST